MKQVKIKEPVRLRQKTLTNGNKSLYLDIYSQGKRRYEFLKLYIIPGASREVKESNKQTLQLANAIKSQRIIELQTGAYHFCPESKTVMFFDYFTSLAYKRKARTSQESWMNCLHYLKMYETKKNLKLTDIDTRWVKGFRGYLDGEVIAWQSDIRKQNRPRQGLMESTKALYFQKLVACLNQAVKDGLIPKSPASNVQGFTAAKSERVYLTIDEVRQLGRTECGHPVLKDMFLFSCMTGLRWSDIINIQWHNIRHEDGSIRIVFTQQKTNNLEYLDISEQAASIIRKCDKGNKSVFNVSMSASMANYNLRVWAAAAGIKKHITFHTGRHTFATMMLTLGADIYTVSKLLGHRDLKTTQVYAEIIDNKKRDAVNRIPSII